MIVRVRNLRLHVDEDETLLLTRAAEKLQITAERIQELTLVRKAVDARRREVFFNYTIDVQLRKDTRLPRSFFNNPELSVVEPEEDLTLTEGSLPLTNSPVVIGMGPCGLFCALLLAQHGYRPILLERGREIEQRVRDVAEFWEQGRLNPESNVQYGEGGAGAFSDGKLTTRIGDRRVDQVLKQLVAMGAPAEITYTKHPHVGTDHLRGIVKNIRTEIIRLGGQVYFNARLTGLIKDQGRLQALIINDELTVPAQAAVLAVGHSARDVYRMLNQMEISLLPKGFAMGVRVEHPQAMIDENQYGQYAGHPRLGPAGYQITYQDNDSGRNVYSFCMCPGGYVIASASAPGQVVTNGMSYHERGSGIANSALVVTVNPGDWDETPLGGMEWQERLERAAFIAGGGNYHAPVQKVADFLAKQPTKDLAGLNTTYRPGVTPSDFWEVLPGELTEPLARAFKDFERKLPGFAGDNAVLTGVETRTSSPVRIER
ncbi:MAG: NAD(P)/FAD-dependent oxidoreductase, partial [Methylocystaceae bacterium]